MKEEKVDIDYLNEEREDTKQVISDNFIPKNPSQNSVKDEYYIFWNEIIIILNRINDLIESFECLQKSTDSPG